MFLPRLYFIILGFLDELNRPTKGNDGKEKDTLKEHLEREAEKEGPVNPK